MDAPVSIVGRVATLLRALAAAEPTGATTATLARHAGLARPTAHRLLTELERHGLAERHPNAHWLLGAEMYLHGSVAAPRFDVSALAEPIVHRLAAKTEESAFFSVRRGEETVCLVRQDGSFPIRSHVLHEGIRFPLGIASAGLAILAFLPDDEVERYLRCADLASSHGDAHCPEAIRGRLSTTRQVGYAVNPGLVVEGSWGMAATVFDDHGGPVGALSVTGVEHRFRPERQPVLGELLRRAAHELTTQLSAQRRSR